MRVAIGVQDPLLVMQQVLGGGGGLDRMGLLSLSFSLAGEGRSGLPGRAGEGT